MYPCWSFLCSLAVGSPIIPDRVFTCTQRRFWSRQWIVWVPESDIGYEYLDFTIAEKMHSQISDLIVF